MGRSRPGTGRGGIGGLKYHKVGLLTANLSYQTEADIIMGYGRALQVPKPDEWLALKRCLTRLKGAYVLRNTYVHAKWMPPKKKDEEIKRSVVRTKGGTFNLADIPTSDAQMTAAAKEIHAAGDEFVKLMQTFGILEPKKKRQRRKPA